MNKNLVAKISHNEYKYILLNKKCFKHSMNRIQSENKKLVTYKINKFSLSCLEDKINNLDNGFIHYLLVLRVDYNLSNIGKNWFLIFGLVRTAFLSSYKAIKLLNFYLIRTPLFKYLWL